MRKPDRIGAIVLVFTLFVAYWGWAGLLYFQGVISLPLGALGSEGLLLVLVDVVIVNLYAFRQRRRARQVRTRTSLIFKLLMLWTRPSLSTIPSTSSCLPRTT